MKKYTVDDNPSMKFCSVIHGFSILLLLFGIFIIISGVGFIINNEYDHMYIVGGDLHYSTSCWHYGEHFC